MKTKVHKNSTSRQHRRQRKATARRRASKIRKKLQRQQAALNRRLEHKPGPNHSQPFFRGLNTFHFDLSQRLSGCAYAGIPLMHRLAQDIGLVRRIDSELTILKFHHPYSESDHILNIAFNVLCGGTCLEDLELRRNDPNYLDILGATRIPDPTTAGDFCRRFSVQDINRLQKIYDDIRVPLWKQQPDEFFEQARIDSDGTLTPTDAECKQGVDIAYDGTWCYHPLLISLANTREVLRIVNRPGNRPSHEGAAEVLDQAIAVCQRGGFRSILLRGDTDFSQTEHLDRWNAIPNVQFIFGYDARRNLEDEAESLPSTAWETLQRPPKYEVETTTRTRPERVKDRIVQEREYKTVHLESEEVAEFDYRPHACKETYRMIVVRKHLRWTQGQQVLFNEMNHRYFFYITNDRNSSATEIVLSANKRCHQENLIEQLKNEACALRGPLHTLESNWALMVITSLAWNLKSWCALRLPETGRWSAVHREQKLWLLGMEFKRFLQVLIVIPCQIVQQARQVVIRLLTYHPDMSVFFRVAQVLRC